MGWIGDRLWDECFDGESRSNRDGQRLKSRRSARGGRFNRVRAEKGREGPRRAEKGREEPRRAEKSREGPGRAANELSIGESPPPDLRPSLRRRQPSAVGRDTAWAMNCLRRIPPPNRLSARADALPEGSTRTSIPWQHEPPSRLLRPRRRALYLADDVPQVWKCGVCTGVDRTGR